jgi:APA family basic amino acid/polyamine antiporter
MAVTSAPTLDRAIGPVAATLLVIGGIVGSGIFLTTGRMALVLPSPTLLMLAWVVGGLFALAGALTYAELSAMYPRAGGVYVYLREAFGPLPAFLYGWAMLLVVLTGGTAAVAVGFAESLSYFAPALSSTHLLVSVPIGTHTFTLSASQIMAAASILVLGGVNYLGVRSSAGTNALLTTIKVSGLLLLPILAVFLARVSPAWTPVVPELPAGGPSTLAAFGVAMIAVLWTNDGFYFITYSAGEVRDPKRNMPRVLTSGLLAVTAIYLSVNLAYFAALPMDQLAGTRRVAEAAASALIGPGGATILALTVVISTLGCNVAAILAGSRLLYGMAADGAFFRPAASVHPRYRSPHVAVISITVWSCLLALSGTYEQLFTYVVFSSVLFSLLGGLALFRLRKIQPHVERPYRVWGFPLVPAVFVLGSVLVVVNTLMDAQSRVQAMIGLGLLALGLPAYWYWRKDRS